MAICDHCGNEFTATPYSCNYCGNRFCSDCRLPEKHNCPGLAGTGPSTTGSAVVDVDESGSGTVETSPGGGWSLMDIVWLPLGLLLLGFKGAKRLLSALANPLVLLTLVAALVLFAGTVGTGYAPIDDPASDALDTLTSLGESEPGSQEAEVATDGGEDRTNAAASSADGALNETAIARAAHQRVNEIRADRGLSRLDWSPALYRVADGHSEDMATRGYFSHTGTDGADFSDRYEQAGIQCQIPISGDRYVTGSENIAYTYANSNVETAAGLVNYGNNETAIGRGLVRQWMNSQRHREAILKPYWNREGIGIGTAKVDGNTRVYATQNFC